MSVGLTSPAAPPLNQPTIHHLSNGLTIIAEQLPVDAVNLNLWFNVGSAIEDDDINGMAHFLEHMMFKGTERLKSGEFEQIVEQRGAVANAATSQDYTQYHITMAPQDFEALTPLQMDVVLQPSISDDAFERERSVILEEIRRADDNPGRRSFYQAMAIACPDMPYSRPVLGTPSVIESLRAEQMRTFHKTWYRPTTMTAVAVGNLPVEQLIQTVADSVPDELLLRDADDLDGIPSRRAVQDLTPTAASVPFMDIIRCETVDPALQQARLIMMWRVPSIQQLDETYPLDVLASILGFGRTARLVDDLREVRSLVSQVRVSNMTYTRQGIFSISARLPEENLEPVEAAVVSHIRQLRDTPVALSEIERVRTQVANRYVFANETPTSRSGLYGYYQSMTGSLDAAIHYPRRIRTVDAACLQQAAQQYLNPEAYGIVVTRPAPQGAAATDG
ncbi:MAG: pitrilysin family protein [Elainellaceae cyanobacterium]